MKSNSKIDIRAQLHQHDLAFPRFSFSFHSVFPRLFQKLIIQLPRLFYQQFGLSIVFVFLELAYNLADFTVKKTLIFGFCLKLVLFFLLCLCLIVFFRLFFVICPHDQQIVFFVIPSGLKIKRWLLILRLFL